MSFMKAQVSFPSNVASISSVIKQNSTILFLAQILCTLFKRSPLKCKFLRFSSARVKIRQIPHFNFDIHINSCIPENCLFCFLMFLFRRIFKILVASLTYKKTYFKEVQLRWRSFSIFQPFCTL